MARFNAALTEALTRRRSALFWCCTVAALGACAVLVWRMPWPPAPLDLGVYRAAGVAVLEGQPALYSPDFGVQTGTALPFTYPPIAAVLAVPLTLLPLAADYVIWTVAGIALLVGYLARHAGRFDVVQATGLVFISVICIWTLPVSDTLSLGQLGIFLTLGCIVGCTSRHPGAAMLIGLFAALKLTPLLFIVYFAITRQWSRLGWALGTFAGLTAFGFVLMPGESVAYFADLASSADRVGDPAFYANQSIAGAIERLGVSSQPLWIAVAGVVTGAGLWLAWRWFRQGSLVAAAVVVGLTTVLVSPVSWQHHAVWIVPAIVFVYARVETAWAKVVVGLTVAFTILRLPIWAASWPASAWATLLSDSLTIVVAGLLGTMWVLERRPRTHATAEFTANQPA